MTEQPPPEQFDGEAAQGPVNREPITALPGETNPFVGRDVQELRILKVRKGMEIGNYQTLIRNLIDEINNIDWAIDAQEQQSIDVK